MKQIVKLCTKSATCVNPGAAQIFERFADNGDDDGDTTTPFERIMYSICNTASLILAIGGMVYTMVLYSQKVLLYVLLLAH